MLLLIISVRPIYFWKDEVSFVAFIQYRIWWEHCKQRKQNPSGLCTLPYLLTNNLFSLSSLLLALHILKNNTKSSGILTKISDDSARALDNLSRVTLRVDLAKTTPLTKNLSLRNLNQRNLTLSAKSLQITKVSNSEPQQDGCKKPHRNPQQGSKSGQHHGPRP